MTTRVNDLREKRAKLIKDAQVVANSDNFGAELQQQFDKMMTEANALGDQIASIQQADEAAASLEFVARNSGAQHIQAQAPNVKAENDARYARAFENLLRRGATEISAEDRTLLSTRGGIQNAQEIATTAKGGFLVPKLFMDQVEKALKNFDGVRQAGARIITTASGAQFSWPSANDTAIKGRLVAEGAAANQTDITFGEKLLSAYTFSSDEVVVSNELLMDSGVDLVSLIADLCGERVGRVLGQFTTTGTGVSQPEGIVTASTMGATKAAAGGITYDILVDLKFSVDKAYRQSPACGFMANDAVIKELVKVKDTTGMPVFLPSTRDGELDRILNHNVFINNEMDATVVATKKPVLFGDMSRYLIRDVQPMFLKVLDQPRGANNQTSFVLFSRNDGKLIDAGAGSVKHLAIS